MLTALLYWRKHYYLFTFGYSLLSNCFSIKKFASHQFFSIFNSPKHLPHNIFPNHFHSNKTAAH